MTKYTRIAWAVACATLLATPAYALGAETATIRVEGATSTLLSERSANIPTGGTATLVDSFDGDVATSSNQSGTSLLARALLDGGLPVGFTNYGPGLGVLITRIGPDAQTAIWVAGAPFYSWKLKVNHAASGVGADSLVMRPGDQVLWSFGDGTEDELDVVGPSAPQMVGAPFTVHVNRYNDGQTVPGTYGPEHNGRANPPVPGSGVTVTYGSQSVTTDIDGNATLITEGGWGNVVAAGTRVIRDSARACGYPAGAPEACGLDPIVRALPDVAPNPRRVTVMTRSGKSITFDLPTPIRGRAPVTISSNDIDSPGLTTAERREVLGRLASALAWQLNDRSAQGDRSLALPGGMRWRAAWLGRSTTVTPLAQGEAVVSQRAQSRTNAAINSRTARVATQRLATCGIDTHASVTRRFGYSMVVVAAPATGARACLARER